MPDDVLAEVVDVVLDGAEHDGGDLVAGRLLQGHAQQAVDLLEDVGREDQLAQVVLAGGELLAHQLHPVLELLQDSEAGNTGREFGIDPGDDGRLVQIAQ